jgi:hypothetical protein
MRLRKLFLVALVLSCVAAEAPGEAVRSLRLVLPPQPDPVVENVGRVFTRQVQSRCDARVLTQGEAPLTVELAIEPGIGVEGYKIADAANGMVRIRGNDNRGLLYGTGKFLHRKVRKITQREEAVVPDEGVAKRPSCWREDQLAGFIAPHGLVHRPEKISHQAAVLPICNRAGKESGSTPSGSLLD